MLGLVPRVVPLPPGRQRAVLSAWFVLFLASFCLQVSSRAKDAAVARDLCGLVFSRGMRLCALVLPWHINISTSTC